MAADSDDEDFRAAIAMSLAESHPSPGDNAETNGIKPEASPPRPQPLPALAGIRGLDRKAMEEERLARLSLKRERSISPPAVRGSRKAPRLETETVTLPSGAMLRSFSTLVDQDQQGRKSVIANAATKQLKRSPSPIAIKAEPKDELTDPESPPPISMKYPRGVVKKTWAYRHDRTGSDIKLESVLEPATLKTAVLSAFQWDAHWVLAKLKTPLAGGSTKCVFVMQGKDDTLREEMLEQSAGWRKFLRLCFPPMQGQIHCMHSKLMLLFHAEKLRVAIPTANLLDFDWGETGVMENSVFMIDLPRLPEGGKTEPDTLTPFARELLYFLDKQGLDQDIRSGVLHFDFAATAGMAFVHTVGGAQYGDDAERTGLPGLARAVRELGLQTGESLEIDFAASSIGSLNDDYLRSVHAAARGEDMIARAGQGITKARGDFFKPQSAAASKSATNSSDIQDRLRIYFPTHDTVASSTAGAAGTICLSRKWYEASIFPRGCFRDYRSTRPGMLSHNKILYARGKQKTSTDDRERDVAWVYVGSANLSESAWGKLVYDRRAKGWKINCRNWECGVLLPVPEARLAGRRAAVKRETKAAGDDDSETESEDEGERGKGREREQKREQLAGLDVFDDIVKPPCEMPGEKYGGKQPWYFQERR